MNLRQLLMREDVKKGIQTNLITSREEVDKAVELTLNTGKENSISVGDTFNGEQAEFENTLHKDTEKGLFLLESRLFTVEDGQMVNAYLEVFNANGEIVQEEIDDVWSYANWEVA